jgi:rod shape determining protein RodA
MPNIELPNTTRVINVSNILGNSSRNFQKKQYKTRKRNTLLDRINVDPILFISLVLLVSLGLMMVYSATNNSSAMIQKHIINYTLGVFTMLFLTQIKTIYLKHIAGSIYVLSLIMLIIVLFFNEVKGSKRWIDLYFIKFQPSELVKLILPIFIASIISSNTIPVNFKTILKSLIFVLIPAFLVYKQPDLGTTIIIIISGLSILFFAGLSWKIIIYVFSFLLMMGPIIWSFVLHSYQKKRVLTFLNPESDPFGSGWNILQSQTAIGSGGITGQGWMHGTQTHLDFLPESHTDFIFAVIAEELGLIGVIALLMVYATIIFRIFYIAFKARYLFDKLLASSIAIIFFIYVFVNTSMVSGLLPIVGVPLPLISYGGSSIISIFAMLGIVMSIGSQNK